MNDISLVFIINNQKYIKDGHFGCQLKSIEKRKLYLGDVRVIAKELMYVWNIKRSWFKYEISWCLVDLPENTNAANEKLRRFDRKLKGIKE
jgi:hypothetical protein